MKKHILFTAIISIILITFVACGSLSQNSTSEGKQPSSKFYVEYECYRNDEQEVSDDDITDTISNLKDLLYDKGYSEALVEVVTRSDAKYIRIEDDKLKDDELLLELIGNPSTLTFRSDADTIKMTSTGNIESCKLAYNTEDGYYLALQFNDQGTTEFAKITKEMTGETLYIYIDDEQLMAPKVNATITGGKVSITGNFTYEEAYNYQVKIQAGCSLVKLRLLKE